MSSTSSKTSVVFNALQEMGVVNAQEISGYSLRPAGAQRDVLKIKYKRAKGSLLPHSRIYKFGRALKTVIADGGTSRMEHTYEISPFLLKAVAELDTLVSDNKNIDNKVKSRIGEDNVSALLSEFNELEALVSSKVSKTDVVAIAARFSRLKAQIAAL